MKKLLTLICLLLCFNVQAADTVFINQLQIPLMVDRQDNILMQIRVNTPKGGLLNDLTLTFAERSALKSIKSLKLYYSGTDTPGRVDGFAPAAYLEHSGNRNTKSANRSYSVLKYKNSKIDNRVSLNCDQPLFRGVNYFWVSIELKPSTALADKFEAQITSVKIDGTNAAISAYAPPTRRIGVGVRYAGNDGVAAYRIPGLVTSKKGTLLAVYDVRYNNSVDLQEHVDIGLSRSTNGGRNWEPMRIAMTMAGYGGLPDAQNGVGDPAILVDEARGALWIIAAWTHGMGNGRAWFNSLSGMGIDTTAQLMIVKSVDDGKTWGDPINITAQVKDPSWRFLLQGPGRGITMENGTIVFAAQFIDSLSMPHATIISSTDGGESWRIGTSARSNTTEAQVIEVTPGVLMLNMRDNRGGSRAVYTTSDLGTTWVKHPSSRSVLQESVCMASILKVAAADNALGRDIILFSNPNTTKGRHSITIKASTDGGLTFPAERNVLLDQGEGWGYSCLTMIDRHTVGIIYEGSTAHLVFQAVPLKDIFR